ncbi:Retroviral-like aspartic protease 1, partial [Stegodyphus mimosarum]
MEEQLRQLVTFFAAFQEEMEGVVNSIKEEMKAGQESVKEEMKAGQESVKEEMRAVKASQEEMKKEITCIIENKFESMEVRIDAVENKVPSVKEQIEETVSAVEQEIDYRVSAVKEQIQERVSAVEHRIEGRVSAVQYQIEKQIDDKVSAVAKEVDTLKKFVATAGSNSDTFKFLAMPAHPSLRLSTYDGKTSWQVYKTQFSIVEEANGWDSQAKACNLAASLRTDAVDILQTLPENKRLDFEALSGALELRFGEKCLKDYSRLQLKSRQQKPTEGARHGSLKISAMGSSSNGLSINGHIDEIPCSMIIDTGANITIIRRDLAKKFKDKLIWTPSCVALETASGDKIDIEGKLNVSITFGSATYHHTAYVADIIDHCILALDFLRKYNFSLDFKNNKLFSAFEDMTIDPQRGSSRNAEVSSERPCSESCRNHTEIEEKPETTSNSPAQMLTGRDLRLPCDF